MSARIIVRLVGAGVLLVIADLALTSWAVRSDVRALATGIPDTTSFMRDAAATGHPVRRRANVPLERIAPGAACAVVLAEDEEFFEKGTVSWRSQRALLQRMLHGDFSRGGSGISQQLARNLFMAPDRTPRRKVREYVIAYELSRTQSKVRLLELYLNVAEWGEGIWGIEAASQHYFGVSAEALTSAQGVVLASFLPAPRRELQYVVGPLASRRQEAIAKKMWRSRLLSDNEHLETIERMREWRAHVRVGRNAREGWMLAAALMGPEPSSFTASLQHAGSLPLASSCNVRRRGF